MTFCRRRTALLALTLVLGGCGAASVSVAPSPIGAAPTPTPVPGVDGGSGSGGNTGGGIVNPPCCKVVDPILGQATVVVPQPGQQNVHPVNVQLVRSSVDGHHVTVELRWWSGVAPCSVLDSVGVGHVDTTYTIEADEGSSGQQVACIDIAQLKATVVDLGDLDPGAYTIKAEGDAPAITVTVS
jgi:hypothetical protein